MDNLSRLKPYEKAELKRLDQVDEFGNNIKVSLPISSTMLVIYDIVGPFQEPRIKIQTNGIKICFN